MRPSLQVRFDAGTLVVHGLAEGAPETPEHLVWDPRIRAHRAEGYRYRELLTELTRRKEREELGLADDARAYRELDLKPKLERTPFPHQREAVERWIAAGSRGVVVLPTGSGKTHVATLAIAHTNRSSLVLVPTLDLMGQWYDLLGAAFGEPIGLLGGGYHEPRELTVATYDSARLHLDRLGARFGLLVFDEVHHLPSPGYLAAAESAIAPFRLGLTATLERNDGREALLTDRVGPVVYTGTIQELSGSHLADYDTVHVAVALTSDEARRYEAERAVYRSFLREMGIRMSAPDGWSRFIMLSSRSSEGRRAFLAYRAQKEIATSSGGKLAALEGLLRQHARDRVLVFTQDNETVHRVSRRFLIPAITHETDLKERREILARFAAGSYPAVVTSKVLNEGIDIPEASVAVVLSGSGSVREHVQRLGRILRRREGKRAVLYELVTQATSEEHTSARRREHEAYR